jgi:CubicO group peptidase (beta-lactamase class C family)
MFEFKRALPEDVGISSGSILNILKELEKKEVPMHSILIMKDDRLVFEKYYAPYTKDTLHRMFSISKSFTALAIFLMADEGKLSLDDKICDFFPEYVNEDTHEYIRMMTLRNLLEMRTCHASTTYKVDMKTDWVESFFKVPPTHKPGTVFHYDTSAAHTLCALVEKLTGKDELTYMKERMLNHLDFSKNSYMVKDPFGVSIGGSGLMATPMDVLKVLYVLSKKGTVECSDGQVRALFAFIEEATSNISDSLMTAPLPSEAQGYGMQMWQNEKGGFVLYGMGGQLAISLPSEKMLVMTTADTQGMQGGNQIIYDTIYKNLLGADAKELSDYDTLMSYADTLYIAPPRLPDSYAVSRKGFDPAVMPEFVKGIADGLDANGGANSDASSTADNDASSGAFTLKYDLDENSFGFTALNLTLSNDGECNLELTLNEKPCRISFGINKMQQGLFPIYDIPYTAGAIFTRDNVLYIRAHLIGECVGSVRFQLFFEEDEVTVFMLKIEETYFNEFDGHLQGRLVR